MENNEYVSEKTRGKGVGFYRIRRITGYLVGSLDRFNSAKACEEHDRVKHGMTTEPNNITIMVDATKMNMGKAMAV